MTERYDSEPAVIRAARPGEAAALRVFVRAAYAKWVAVIGREPLPMTADYDLAIRDHQIDIVVARREWVAVIEWMARPDHMFIENIAVAPEHQGRGWGRRLLARAESRALAMGLPEIRLQTNAAFASNVKLYAKLGYRVDRREEFRGGVAVSMSKRVVPEGFGGR
jgi:ribosomal protein S18 acetylase RimI-like enzyme